MIMYAVIRIMLPDQNIVMCKAARITLFQLMRHSFVIKLHKNFVTESYILNRQYNNNTHTK